MTTEELQANLEQFAATLEAAYSARNDGAFRMAVANVRNAGNMMVSYPPACNHCELSWAHEYGTHNDSGNV